jgi:uncharacterized protein (DUF2267 family)
MSETGLEVFDTTVQRTNSWLKDVMHEMEWRDRSKAYRALRATLHALRDRLTVEETAQFAAQLPMLIRGFYYEGWDPTGKPVKARHKREFLAQVEHELRPDERADAERVARAVFWVIAHRITQGEIDDLERLLPAEIRELWPSPAQAAAESSRQSA